MTDIPVTWLLPWIPALPLAAAILTALAGPRLLKAHSHWPTIVALALSTVCALLVLFGVYARNAAPTAAETGYEQVVALWTWVDVGNAYLAPDVASDVASADGGGRRDFRVDVALRADSLTAAMLAMVTFVSTLVAIFAAGYMKGDRGYWRFFSYIGLFVFSMTMLVSVSNFVLLFVFWEAVGACSYLLIGFWYGKPEAAAAGKKAFLVNRVGDFGFMLALFLIWTTYGTLNFHDTSAATGDFVDAVSSSESTPDSTPDDVVPGVLGPTRVASGDYARGPRGPATVLAICLLLTVGACGKSAQFPLHVWLPDAMEGPTPVSALIHAATMVTAGVYMIARCTPLFAASPDGQLVVAVVGAATALLAALIALSQFDLKRVLAYSTISQLGYMFVGLGVGTLAGVSAGMFHLLTHAFFKALLFLGAGSVMHAMGGVIDMRRFGGLRRIMPITYWTFLIGCLALAGLPPLAGFWSKDSIVASVHDRVHELEHASHSSNHDAERNARGSDISRGSASPLGLTDHGRGLIYRTIYYGALVTALLTAFYTFRAFLMTFHGPLRVPAEAGDHAHESPPSMTMPLIVLSVFAALLGLALDWTPWRASGHLVANYLARSPSLAGGFAETPALDRFHPSVALLSTLIAAAGVAGAVLHFRYRLTAAGRKIMSVFDRHFAPHLSSVSLGSLSRNRFYLDEIYQVLLVRPLLAAARWSAVLDDRLVDRLVDFVGRLPRELGSLMRALQMGLVQFYGLATVLLVVVIVAVRLLWTSG